MPSAPYFVVDWHVLSLAFQCKSSALFIATAYGQDIDKAHTFQYGQNAAAMRVGVQVLSAVTASRIP